MSEIKNDRLGLYGAEHSNHMMTPGLKAYARRYPQFGTILYRY